MQLHQLAYALAVAEEESFTRAADRLHLAQPSLSRQVRLLEQELGVVLFNRGPGQGRVTLTPDCSALLPFLQRVLADIEATGAEARALSGMVRGHLGVGDRHPVEIGPGLALGVPVRRVDRDPEPPRRLRPLVLEVLRGRHDRDRQDLTPGQQLFGDRQRVGRLSRTRGRDEQEVTLSKTEILCVSSFLPAAKNRKIRIQNGGG